MHDLQYWIELAKGLVELEALEGQTMTPDEVAFYNKVLKSKSVATVQKFCAELLAAVRETRERPMYVAIPVAVVREHLLAVDLPNIERRIRSIVGGARLRGDDDYSIAMERVNSLLQSGTSPESDEIVALNRAILAYEKRVVSRSRG